jgi:predicted AlkP superfamily phosphohydrolase/phosphomutase
MQEGAWGALRSTVPPHSAPAWSSFATGANPGRHGVYHFRPIDRRFLEGNSSRVVNARSIALPTIWAYASRAGKCVGVINVPLTYPPEPINGFMVTGMLTPPSADVFTYPPELSRKLADYQIDVTSGTKFGAVESLDLQNPETLQQLCTTLERQLEIRARTAVRLVEEYNPDLLVLVFTETDRLHHYFWHYLTGVQFSPHSPGERFFHQWVEDFYCKIDEAVGQVWAAMGSDAVHLIVSDHGFGPFPPREFYVNVWLRQKGWLRLKRKGLRGWLVRQQAKINQTWLRYALSLLPKHRQRAIRIGLGKQLSLSVDWEHTRACFILLSTSVGGVLVPGDPSGEEYEATREEVAQALISLTDPSTDRPVVQQVWRREELYTGPFTDRAPDLVVAFDPAYRVLQSMRGQKYLLQSAAKVSHWTGSHRLEGILLAGGPAVRPGPLPESRLEDIAPTILYLLGLPIPDDMDGRVLQETIRPERLRDAPPRRTTVSYSDTGKEATEWDHPDDEVEVEGRLRMLGYID